MQGHEMDVKPPAGFRIFTATNGLDPVIVIPAARNPRVPITAVFVTCCLFVGVAVGLNAASKILSGNGNAFLVVWTGLWTLGVVFAAHTVYRALRPPVRGTLILKHDKLCYDSGFIPLLLEGRNISFPKRVRIDIDRDQLQSLRLRGNVCGQWRLTVDVGTDRIDILPNASAVEREWVARFLAGHYSIRQIWASANDV
jgi:hypothetical protein